MYWANVQQVYEVTMNILMINDGNFGGLIRGGVMEVTDCRIMGKHSSTG